MLSISLDNPDKSLGLSEDFHLVFYVLPLSPVLYPQGKLQIIFMHTDIIGGVYGHTENILTVNILLKEFDQPSMLIDPHAIV